MSYRSSFRGARRRLRWIQRLPPLGAAITSLGNLLAYLLRRQRAAPLPSLVKIDISPQCHLACPHCLHARSAGRDRPQLEAQRFAKTDRMSVAQFAGIIREIEGKALAVSLFYYGDPLIHPQLDEMIAIASRAGLSVHITTHFSYRFTRERIRRLVESGLTHITVAVDGATQESYATTRVNGKLDLVLANLRMLRDCKAERRSSHPYVEVQHLAFAHHAADEEAQVRAIAAELGADGFKRSNGLRFNESGDLYNVVDDDPLVRPSGPAKAPHLLPLCHWPYSSTVIKSNGDVIPCCNWKAGRQYAPRAESGAVGNVFQAPLAAIWNGPAYRRVRQEVLNPRRHGCAGSFCEGCPQLYRAPQRIKAPVPAPVDGQATALVSPPAAPSAPVFRAPASDPS